MRKVIVTIMLAAWLMPAAAQKPGIRFFDGNWTQALELARRENKKIFADFYTEWCGPCLNMSLKVFVLPEVGDLYNRNFVCVKIDAEKGEGVELAKRYGVSSYPAYIFVDPANGQVVHRSGSNKSAERFMRDAQGAVSPKSGSVYMDAKYASGNYDAQFLKEYIMMKDASLSRDAADLFAKLPGMGCKLTDPDVWDIYVKTIPGYNNPYLKEVSDNYDRFTALFGRDAVDAKLAEASAHAPVEVLVSLHDFSGRRHNMLSREITDMLQAKRFADAYAMVVKLQNDPQVDQAKLIHQMSFYVRILPGRYEDEIAFDELLQKFRLLRYVAYNAYDRDEASVHYNYAAGLEYLVRRSQQEGKPLPHDMLAEPAVGKQEYDMRHPELKAKPSRQPKQ